MNENAYFLLLLLRYDEKIQISDLKSTKKHSDLRKIMNPMLLQSPLQNFAELIGSHFVEIWDFLIIIGGISGVILVLTGAIIWLTLAHVPRGRGLIFGGIILCIVIEYFVLFPPSFVTP